MRLYPQHNRERQKSILSTKESGQRVRASGFLSTGAVALAPRCCGLSESREPTIRTIPARLYWKYQSIYRSLANFYKCKLRANLRQTLKILDILIRLLLSMLQDIAYLGIPEQKWETCKGTEHRKLHNPEQRYQRSYFRPLLLDVSKKSKVMNHWYVCEVFKKYLLDALSGNVEFAAILQDNNLLVLKKLAVLLFIVLLNVIDSTLAFDKISCS